MRLMLSAIVAMLTFLLGLVMRNNQTTKRTLNDALQTKHRKEKRSNDTIDTVRKRLRQNARE